MPNQTDGDINQVTLRGVIAYAPEVRFGKTGTAVCNVKIKTVWSYKGKTGMEFHRVVVFGDSAEAVGQAAVGAGIYVEGRLQTRQWVDKEQKKRETTEVVANSVELLGGAQQSPPSGGGSRRPNPPAPGFDDPEPGAGGGPSEDSIPF